MKLGATKNPALVNALKSLYTARLSGATNKRVVTLIMSFDLAETSYNKNHKDIVTKYYKLDEKGEPVMKDGNPEIDESRMPELQKEIETLAATDLAITGLDQSDLDNLPVGILSGAETKLLQDVGLVNP